MTSKIQLTPRELEMVRERCFADPARLILIDIKLKTGEWAVIESPACN